MAAPQTGPGGQEAYHSASSPDLCLFGAGQTLQRIGLGLVPERHANSLTPCFPYLNLRAENRETTPRPGGTFQEGRGCPAHQSGETGRPRSGTWMPVIGHDSDERHVRAGNPGGEKRESCRTRHRREIPAAGLVWATRNHFGSSIVVFPGLPRPSKAHLLALVQVLCLTSGAEKSHHALAA